MTEASREQLCGRHRVRVDGAVLVVHFIGNLSADEGRQLLAICEQQIRQHGHAYLLALVDQAGSIDASFRRELMTWMKANPQLSIANVRASPVARTVGILLGNAFRLMGVVENSTAFFESEEAARAWLAERATQSLKPSL
jgi:hypothetical protein